jgi:NTE family protein
MPHGAFNELSAATTTLTGVPGFFTLRLPPAALMPPGTVGASSFYDTAPLRATLLELVDFERLNNGPVRLSVGAVNVETGNIVFFDSADREIGPEHIMASGALPPGFPAIEIDGAHYWDGGLVSNTPLQYILDEERQSDDLCIFQIDLFNARGALPDSVWTTESREKDIRFSSRTRFNTDMMARLHAMRLAARKLYDKLPPDLRDDPDVRELVADEMRPAITVAHLIYRQAKYERQSRDYEFSRTSMLAHWDAGARDVETSLAHPAWQARKPKRDGGIQVFDLTRDEP